MSSPLPLSSGDSAFVLQASKWLSIQLLINDEEMAALFQVLGFFEIWHTGAIGSLNPAPVPHQQFLDVYREYIQALKHGLMPNESLCRKFFTSVWTRDRNALFLMDVGNNQGIVKLAKPVLQVQNHRMAYSKDDGKFRPMILGAESIYWGIQVAYPQVMQDKEFNIVQVFDDQEITNTSLFKSLQQWVRKCTLPTPFLVNEKKVNVPMRLGKNCLSWINNHPQLIDQGIRVQT